MPQLFRNIAAEHPVDFRLITTAFLYMLSEPGKHVGIKPNGDGLFERSVEISPASVGPVLRWRLGNIQNIDLIVRQISQLGQLITLIPVKVLPAHNASFHAGWPCEHRQF